MKQFRKFPFFLYLLPLLFFLVSYTDYGTLLRLKKILPQYLLIYMVIFLVYFILNRFYKFNKRNALLVFIVAGIYLFFGYIKNSIEGIPYISTYSLFFLFIFIFLVFFYYVTKKKKRAEQLFLYCNVLLVVLCISQAGIIFFGKQKTDAYRLEEISFQDHKLKQTPSIHLIVWDGYPGFRSLKEHFNYDNTAIRFFLESKGFYVFDTIHSNYYQTYNSVNSLLNMQYLSYLHQVPLNEYYTILQGVGQINENQLIGFLKKYHYTIYNNSIFELDNVEVLNQNPHFISSETIHFKEIFHHRFLTDNLWKLAVGKYRHSSFAEKLRLKRYRQNMAVIRSLLKNKPTFPHFTYTHVIMPHDPYFTDSLGQLLSQYDQAKNSDHGLFINYLKYTNKKIKKIVSQLVKKEPNSIVILMSDHGFRDFKSKRDFHYRFDNFLAIRSPQTNNESIKKIRSNVNIFRTVLNQYFDQKFTMLPDSCIIVNENKNTIRAKSVK